MTQEDVVALVKDASEGGILSKETVIPILDVTLFHFVSVLAVVSTVALILTGVPWCLQIIRAGSSEGYTASPFLVGNLVFLMWLMYGILIWDLTIITLNLFGTIIYIGYMLVFYVNTARRGFLHRQLIVLFCLQSLAVAYGFSEWDTLANRTVNLGRLCVALNIIGSGSVLTALKDVIRIQSSENLPLEMCIGKVWVVSLWLVYGIIVNDFYITAPNIPAGILAGIQLSLFCIFPNRKKIAAKSAAANKV